jgi:hypothetical protein
MTTRKATATTKTNAGILPVRQAKDQDDDLKKVGGLRDEEEFAGGFAGFEVSLGLGGFG